jgi:hypothetical protein
MTWKIFGLIIGSLLKLVSSILLRSPSLRIFLCFKWKSSAQDMCRRVFTLNAKFLYPYSWYLSRMDAESFNRLPIISPKISHVMVHLKSISEHNPMYYLIYNLSNTSYPTWQPINTPSSTRLKTNSIPFLPAARQHKPWVHQLLFIHSWSSRWWAASLPETCRGLLLK